MKIGDVVMLTSGDGPFTVSNVQSDAQGNVGNLITVTWRDINGHLQFGNLYANTLEPSKPAKPKKDKE